MCLSGRVPAGFSQAFDLARRQAISRAARKAKRPGDVVRESGVRTDVADGSPPAVFTIRYDTIEEINVDSKAEYTA